MQYKQWIGVLLLCVITVFAIGAQADTPAGMAEDITKQCKFRASETPYSSNAYFHDKDLFTYWKSKQEAQPWIRVTTPEDVPAFGLYVCFASQTPVPWQVQVKDENSWTTVARGEGKYLHEYVSLPGVTVFRITTDTAEKERLMVGELYILGKGEVPGWVQFWEPAAEKADILLLGAHPDDEFVFFGGLLPVYAVERGYDVMVACLTYYDSQRISELLNGLWAAGIRSYPYIGLLTDRYSRTLKGAYEICGGKDAVWEEVTALFRQYQPDVVVTHDTEGEYGHGMHMACADAALRCVTLAADASAYPQSAEAYGTWQPQKLYLHLYPENTIGMDWDQPLDAYEGLTGYQVANLALEQHISQHNTSFSKAMEAGHPHSSYVFGLAFSAVGEDVMKNDFMENIE